MFGRRKQGKARPGTVNNRWGRGATHLVVPPLLSQWIGTSAARLEERTFDEKVGPETVLFLFERPEYLGPIAKAKPFSLVVKNGLARTDHGAIIFLLYQVLAAGKKVCVYESYLNPHQEGAVALLAGWGRQTHLKVILVDSLSSEVEGFFEIENTFDISDLLHAAQMVAASEPDADFDAAQRDFTGEYSVEDLLAM